MEAQNAVPSVDPNERAVEEKASFLAVPMSVDPSHTPKEPEEVTRAMIETANKSLIDPPYEGPTVKLAGFDWTVAALPLGPLKRNREHILKMSQASKMGDADPTAMFDYFDSIVAVLLAALKRNYPKITHEIVGEILDIGSIGKTLPVVMGASGLMKIDPKTPGQDAAPAKVEPALPSSISKMPSAI